MERTGPDDANIRERSRDRYGRASFISKVFWCWLDPLFILGCRKRHLNQEDLYDVPSHAKSKIIQMKLERFWKQELERRSHGGKARLWVAVFKLLWPKLLLHLILSFLQMLCLLAQGILVGLLADYFTGDITEENTRNAYLYATGIVVCAVILSFTISHGFLLGQNIGMLARVALTGTIYKKIFNLPLRTIGEITIGKIVTLASYDVHRVEVGFYHAPFVFVGPLHIIVVLVLLWDYLGLGPSALAGVGPMVLFISAYYLLGILFAKLRFASSKYTDERVKVMHEIISGIRVIKMYGWEYAFKKAISAIRKKETRLILYSGFIRGMHQAVKYVSNEILLVLMLTTFTLSTGQPLTPSIVFTSILLIDGAKHTAMIDQVEGILELQETKVGFSRIEELLLSDFEDNVQNPVIHDVDKATADCMSEANITRGLTSEGKLSCVVVDNLSAAWKGKDEDIKLVLKDISFTCDMDRRLLAIVGPVGAGKSSILHCLLGELQPLKGSIEIVGRIGYSSQDSWVFSGTVRENILFGQEFEEDWYEQVLGECCLKEDMSLLPFGDLTLVGERGVTLSGGQKARITLARAIYRKANVYILDDPLSAVDAVVGRRLFQTCMSGVLKDSIIVLVTHHLQYAKLADAMLVIDQGEALAYGTYEEILSMVSRSDENAAYARVKDVLSEMIATNDEDIGEIVFDVGDMKEEIIRRKIDEDTLCADEGNVAVVSPTVQRESEFIENTLNHTLANSSNTVPLEEKLHGSVTVWTYYRFFKAGGGYIGSLLTVVLFILVEGCTTVANWWPAEWANLNSTCGMENSTHFLCELSTDAIIAIYFGIVSGSVALSLMKGLLFWFVCIHAGQVLHDRMFAAVLRAPIRFFDTNPIGRVLNRFSKDLRFMDDLLPFFFFDTLSVLLRVISIIVLASIANYYILIVAAIMLCVFLLIRWYYLTTVREVKRLEAIARSPLFSHITATLQGLPTIRACERQNASIEYFHAYQDEQTKGWSTYINATRWLGLRVDFISALFITLVMFLAIPLTDSLDASLIGLSITYSISLTDWCQYGVRSSAEVESLMISAERLMAYGRLLPEAPLETPPGGEKPPPLWPSCGSVRFQNVNFRYSSNIAYVLKDINVHILPGEKIGIIGRTGAGKSSLVQALFRMAEPEGIIEIDGVSITRIGLHDLRQKISIIPQDPVLFSGSVRYNMDPFSEYSDEEIWISLEQVQLKQVIQNMDHQLGASVTEGGSNFSVGQRQLMCLGRALLRKNKILVIDEATANVDMTTDAIIQETIRREFADCTTLTIAHRLNTIMDADRIMVLSSGRIQEFDVPHHLLSDPHSLLYRMVDQTGESQAKRLRAIAAEKYFNKQDLYMW